MSDRGARRGGGGAPFYAPPKRKTSAEIISEARAAVYGEMSGGTSAGGTAGALRPLRTRRPFTPREPQRTLFSDRTRKKESRPPSSFDMKHLSLSESSEEALLTMGARVTGIDEDIVNESYFTEAQHLGRKKAPLRHQSKSVHDRSAYGWKAFPKLPNLDGRAKPLHKRNTLTTDETAAEAELLDAIAITHPMAFPDYLGKYVTKTDVKVDQHQHISKSLSPEGNIKRKAFGVNKSMSCDTNVNKSAIGDIGVRHLSVQLPNTAVKPSTNLESLSILEICDNLSQRSKDLDRVVSLMEILQKRLELAVPPSSLRDLVIRALFVFIDSEDERILVAIARCLLMLRVTGTHLASACKLLFRIARDDKNDHYFRDTNLLELLVEGCGRADPVTESECCVYGAGALRVLALDPRLCARAHRAGAVHLAAIHLKLLNTAKADSPRALSDQCTHAMYQLTGALRNLASEARAANEFVSSGALAELLGALTHHTDRDVLTNVARCLSVLSVHDCCCLWLCSAPNSARALVRALAACGARAPLAVRLAYTLGNMAAADERARHNIYNEEGGVDVLLTILESYTTRGHFESSESDGDPDLHLIVTDLGGSDGSNEDVLIKTARVVANLCLTERAGRGLAASYAERTVKALLACLDHAEKPTPTNLPEEELINLKERREELATAALATLNNVTFYREPPDPPDPLDDTLDSICKAACIWLSRGGCASCEAVRALGNLTRAPRAAQLLVLHGALDALVPYLEHDDPEVRCGAAGVLVNVCGAGAGAARGALAAGVALDSAAARKDAAAAALLARALWNAHTHTPVHAELANQAAAALAFFIDDESVFEACEASRYGDRRASDPSIQHHVHFEYENNNESYKCSTLSRTLSVEQDLQHTSEDEACSGEDLGFEDGGEECDCGPCRRLASWEELVNVAIPLLEKLRPPKHDASVGTD